MRSLDGVRPQTRRDRQDVSIQRHMNCDILTLSVEKRECWVLDCCTWSELQGTWYFSVWGKQCDATELVSLPKKRTKCLLVTIFIHKTFWDQIRVSICLLLTKDLELCPSLQQTKVRTKDSSRWSMWLREDIFCGSQWTYQIWEARCKFPELFLLGPQCSKMNHTTWSILSYFRYIFVSFQLNWTNS